MVDKIPGSGGMHGGGASHHLGGVAHQSVSAGFQGGGGGPAHHHHGGGPMGGHDDGGANFQGMGPGASQSGAPQPAMPQGKTATNLNELESYVNSITSKPNNAKLK